MAKKKSAAKPAVMATKTLKRIVVDAQFDTTLVEYEVWDDDNKRKSGSVAGKAARKFLDDVSAKVFANFPKNPPNVDDILP